MAIKIITTPATTTWRRKRMASKQSPMEPASQTHE